MNYSKLIQENGKTYIFAEDLFNVGVFVVVGAVCRVSLKSRVDDSVLVGIRTVYFVRCAEDYRGVPVHAVNAEIHTVFAELFIVHDVGSPEVSRKVVVSRCV